MLLESLLSNTEMHSLVEPQALYIRKIFLLVVVVFFSSVLMITLKRKSFKLIKTFHKQSHPKKFILWIGLISLILLTAIVDSWKHWM